MQGRSGSYRYDALDRLAAQTPYGDGVIQRSYCADRLASESEGGRHRRFLRSELLLLAQLDGSAQGDRCVLLAPDRPNSVVTAVADGRPTSFAYAPYGYRQDSVPFPALPGFNGEHPDLFTGHYLLGNGYRAYNPLLMRFNSPDSRSPFGKGGLNAYAYCAGDPVNRTDPSGHDLESDIASGLYIFAGVMTAVIGLAGARPAVSALWKGVKVPAAPAATAGRAVAAHYRPANLAEKVSAVVPVAALAAGTTWLAGFVTRVADQESQATRILSWIAVGISWPTMLARGGLYVRSRSLQHAARSAASRAPRSSVAALDEPGTPVASLSRRGSVIRDVEDTPL
ncbi:RHS repeat-associated core domain-containing protein [Pseudomonas sp. v388]|nr:RHS repeat-associated core domain-containing protein [Pseudomonas sp. v388]